MELGLAMPQEAPETGIRKGFLEDLALKVLYLNGEMSLVELSDHLCLGPGVIDGIFQFLRKEQLCEVKGMVGGIHRIAASMQGKMRAAEPCPEPTSNTVRKSYSVISFARHK